MTYNSEKKLFVEVQEWLYLKCRNIKLSSHYEHLGRKPLIGLLLQCVKTAETLLDKEESLWNLLREQRAI
jgi:hypothetical protein